MAVKPIPDGYHTVTPYLIVRDVPKLLDFLARAFGAQEKERVARPDGTIMHAEVRIGDSIVMMGEANDEFKAITSMIHLYVPDVDAVYDRAVQAGATSIRALANQPYGDRSGGVLDPAGNQWWISTHVEDVSHDEMMRRFAQMNKQPTAAGAH